MKKLLPEIKNKIKKIISFKKINSNNHWRFLLYIFLITTTILIGSSFYLLNKIKNQQIFQITVESKKQPILMNEKLLDRVNESFEQKVLIEKEIKDGLKSYKDPSIN